jgi:hypothetical protein
MNTEHWDRGGVPALERQIDLMTDAALTQTTVEDFIVETAYDKVYWIMAVGPHWRCGVRDEGVGQSIQPLMDWRHTIHDEDSFQDRRRLASLVDRLSGLMSAERLFQRAQTSHLLT